MKKALFVLSGNLSTTPRAVKAIQSMPLGTTCELILVNRDDEWKKKDKEIINFLGIKTNYVELGRDPFLPWFKASLYQKLATFVYRIKPKSELINAYLSNKSSIVLWEYLKKQDYSYIDLIIGHSSGSLYPGFRLSSVINKPFVFDVEDYHPGESIAFDAENEKQRREFLMQALLPKVSAVTFASPLIEKYTKTLVGNLNNSDTVLNGFNSDEFVFFEPKKTNVGLKLVWFSQKVSFGRGLEQLFEAFIILNESQPEIDLELTLIGEMDLEFQNKVINPLVLQLKDSKIQFFIKKALQQKELHAEVCRYDVGLALEFDSRDLNRQICLTNKIITYAQAGLYILATDTKAQDQFIGENPELGVLSQQSSQNLADTLLSLCQNASQIKAQKQKRFNLGKKLSWDQEQEKLKSIWQQIL
ncbi:glycosyltransferase [Mangrovimonas sp. YM274]|uniref:glycosyltransferase n=1 Tax=Mangrovimonas sp. YM274 TaxID=3070660 RepID=UPI0027DD1275|nr:glycosyltransferase [Mangrovimonas sp. YM274]WMI68448.1 glycosyltransferase [Mangrovimonas sp. YM274]